MKYLILLLLLVGCEDIKFICVKGELYRCNKLAGDACIKDNTANGEARQCILNPELKKSK